MVLTELEPQLFCIDCARRNAEVAVGSFRHEFGCLSLDQCPGGFSKTERRKFLDVKLTAALDRIEREAALRSAMIPNLESCSACDYAAVYPPVEENKVFVCENPLCGKVICRLCRMDSHLPLSCKEAKASLENSARKEIEESMSAALIRKCNKCKFGFRLSSGAPPHHPRLGVRFRTNASLSETRWCKHRLTRRKPNS